MQADERDAGYLWDMREAARDCIDFVKEATYEQFGADKMMRSAVERRLEILGEAAGRISEAFQAAHPRFHGKRSRVYASCWPTAKMTLTFINFGAQQRCIRRSFSPSLMLCSHPKRRSDKPIHFRLMTIRSK
jgi:hypothetical protein